MSVDDLENETRDYYNMSDFDDVSYYEICSMVSDTYADEIEKAYLDEYSDYREYLDQADDIISELEKRLEMEKYENGLDEKMNSSKSKRHIKKCNKGSKKLAEDYGDWVYTDDLDDDQIDAIYAAFDAEHIDTDGDIESGIPFHTRHDLYAAIHALEKHGIYAKYESLDEDDWLSSEFDYAYILTSYSFEDNKLSAPEITDSTKEFVIKNGVLEKFHNIYNKTKVEVPRGVTSIGDKAFYKCKGLTSITIPDSVTSIGEHAFDFCHNLTEVHISNLSAWCSINSTHISSNPLWFAGKLYLNNTLITDLVIPSNVTSIGEHAFSCCTALTSITILGSVTSIGDGAFYGCTGPTSITIPDSVTSIGWYAFEGCIGLTDVYYLGTEEEWNNIDIEQGNDHLLDANIHFNSELSESYRRTKRLAENINEDYDDTQSYEISFSGSCTVRASSKDLAEDIFWNIINNDEALPDNLYDIDNIQVIN